MGDPNSEGISCEILYTGHLRADITAYSIMLEILIFEGSQLCIPAAQGNIDFPSKGEGRMVMVTIDGDNLRCPGEEGLPGVFHTPCVLQAIMQNPRIGGVWIIRLCAAPNEETGEFQSSETDWETVSDIARGHILGKESNNCNNHVVDTYLKQLKYLDSRLRARYQKQGSSQSEHGQDTPDSAATTSLSTRKPTSGHEHKA
ncbi:uncharacterized protein N7515_001277 [Penicillium bovifimosum]|uniref:Uncharacterized protein n=1 Tax=Penicillium bovifimosum TaxID=126998 RepID=A0A9W9H9E2_9EURO|nr:uncharacterized protein N7515_001277 [Penicillium bovifimosum]KAJ5142490.1 hypothetical protein N7515_001277 [Penicillium bovifimosum]